MWAEGGRDLLLIGGALLFGGGNSNKNTRINQEPMSLSWQPIGETVTLLKLVASV